MIVDPLVLLAFVPAALALNVTPGADMMFCLGQGLRSGPRQAVAAAAGVAAGGFVHATLAGLGLSAVMAAWPLAFDVVRWLGVGYLLWLAVQALRQGGEGPKGRAMPAGRAFRQGMVVNLANPKVILFTLAFIPQFVDPSRGAVLGQFLLLGAVISAGGMAVNSAVGLSAGGLGKMLAGGGRAARALSWLSAGIFGALALRLAVMERA
ncbi:LysE family transporter [Aquicoccus sp. SCR17]|nr:LysE family transporter [Carideicomes alvinocaridis]